MSLKNGEVKLDFKPRKGLIFLIFLSFTEFVLTIAFVVTLASHILFPDQVRATLNQVSKVLSYEGRLTDASGNPLGGTGTNYCFRFSIYNQGGTKVWPAGTPVTNTVNVINGVFAVGIGTTTSVGGSADDLATYDFYNDDSIYLNIEATSSLSNSCAGESSFVTLSPRQRLDAVAFARSANDVYGRLLKTASSSNLVQVGNGSGATTPILLGLDWKNVADSTLSYVGQSCSINGTMWYNSNTSHALICEGGVVQELGTVATTSIAAINANAGTPVSAGTVVFSNGNGVTFGINASTITASVNAAGGGITLNSTALGNNRGWAQSSVSLGQNSLYISPHNLVDAVAASAIKIPVMVTNSSSAFAAHTRGYTLNLGIYTRHATNSTVLTQHYSTSYTAGFSANSNGTWAGTIITGLGNSTSYNTVSASSAGLNLSSASFHGPREFIIPLYSTLSAGEYWFAVRNSSSTAGAAGNLFNVSFIIASSQTQNPLGQASNIVSFGGIGQNIGLGTYSVTTGAMPGGISMTQINRAATNPIFYLVNETR